MEGSDRQPMAWSRSLHGSALIPPVLTTTGVAGPVVCTGIVALIWSTPSIPFIECACVRDGSGHTTDGNGHCRGQNWHRGKQGAHGNDITVHRCWRVRIDALARQIQADGVSDLGGVATGIDGDRSGSRTGINCRGLPATRPSSVKMPGAVAGISIVLFAEGFAPLLTTMVLPVPRATP